MSILFILQAPLVVSGREFVTDTGSQVGRGCVCGAGGKGFVVRAVYNSNIVPLNHVDRVVARGYAAINARP